MSKLIAMSVLDTRTGIGNLMLLADIFYTILDCFYPEDDPEERQALASLARTCRALSEPSLDCLWRKLDSLEPLIRCYARVDDIKNAIPPSSSQFAIIDRYAHRVRELSVSGDTALYFLQSTTMQTCLLPNLRTLRWNSGSRSPHIPIVLIQRLLNPKLVYLQVTFAEDDDANLPSFFDDILVCRNLKTLEFHFSTGALALSATTIQALSSAICRQKTLKNVVVDVPINDAALEHLSTLPTLKVLAVHLPERLRQQTGSFQPSEPVFCGVKELALNTSSNLELATSLLQTDSQVFRSFHLRYNSRLTSEALVTFLNVLSSRSPTKPLQRLHLTCGDFSHLPPADWMASEARHHCLSYRTLQPLMAFGSLHYLMIVWSEQIALDDDQLAVLAPSWPLLQTFYLSCHRGPYPPFPTKYPTLRGLLTLVSSCPLLESVSLPLDATYVPEVEEAEPFANLKYLYVPESPIDQAVPVAEFLFRYFPSLELLYATFLRATRGTDQDLITAYEVAWQQVEDYIGELRGIPPDYGSVDSEDDDDDDDDGEEPGGLALMAGYQVVL